MTEEEERSYEDGSRAAWAAMLRECLSRLGHDGNEQSAAALQIEDTRIALRSLCEEIGENDWEDDLHLADVVNNYVIPKIADLGKPRARRRKS